MHVLKMRGPAARSVLGGNDCCGETASTWSVRGQVTKCMCANQFAVGVDTWHLVSRVGSTKSERLCRATRTGRVTPRLWQDALLDSAFAILFLVPWGAALVRFMS